MIIKAIECLIYGKCLMDTRDITQHVYIFIYNFFIYQVSTVSNEASSTYFAYIIFFQIISVHDVVIFLRVSIKRIPRGLLDTDLSFICVGYVLLETLLLGDAVDTLLKRKGCALTQLGCACAHSVRALYAVKLGFPLHRLGRCV